MMGKIPENGFHRSLTGGKTAVKMGGKVLKYLAGKPFLKGSEKVEAKEQLSRESADVLFKGLSLLRGTALKIAQQLSLEMDLFPREIRQELEKSYHQVPPLNRALIRKVVTNELDWPPEKVFSTFGSMAFAAASLGQVHRATSLEGGDLAVKIQYPGIDRTIAADIRMVKNLLRPSPDYRLYRSALEEIEARLLEEIDYDREAGNMAFFKSRLRHPALRIPEVHKNLSTRTILSQTFLEGLPLDRWIATAPPQEARDTVARVLNELFYTSLYELNCVHADPNPGNYLIGKDLSIGLVDFGCVKKLDKSFVESYRQLPTAILHPDREVYLQLLTDLKMIRSPLRSDLKERFYQATAPFSRWFGRLFEEEAFDFGAHPGFFAEGRKHMDGIYRLRRHLDMNPDFIFLDRTRYGLLRIFEKLGARVAMRNTYEWELDRHGREKIGQP